MKAARAPHQPVLRRRATEPRGGTDQRGTDGREAERAAPHVLSLSLSQLRPRTPCAPTTRMMTATAARALVTAASGAGARASPAMSPALQGLSGLAESFSPEQIPVDEDEQARNRLAKSRKGNLAKSGSETQSPERARDLPLSDDARDRALPQPPNTDANADAVPAQPPHGTLSPGAAVAGMEPAAAPVSAPGRSTRYLLSRCPPRRWTRLGRGCVGATPALLRTRTTQRMMRGRRGDRRLGHEPAAFTRAAALLRQQRAAVARRLCHPTAAAPSRARRISP